MPLPEGGGAWPPRELDLVTARLDVWSTWYSGDPDRLSFLYGGSLAGDPGRPVGYPDPTTRGWRGWLGRLASRWFWGVQTPDNEKRTKLHLPLAGDIAAASADLLFSEPPTLKAADGDEATQQALDDLIEDGLHADLLEAAEVCAGLGGVYLRNCWDDGDNPIRDRPWISAVHADCAVPTWRYGRLVAVTFWQVVHRDGNDVWRHLERHEQGVILHGLYKGGERDLGKPVPLASHEATRGLREAVPTGLGKGLTAGYVPNMRPARVWRDVPEGAHLGRADVAGLESEMDGLDEVWSSLMRDIRLGKGRVFVPETMLQSQGKGQGATFDADAEFLYPVNALMSTNPQGGLPLMAQQFAIRVAEHLQTARALQDQIVRSAGYSTQTFGSVDGEGGASAAQTATEVDSKTRRTDTTRGRKITYWRPELAERVRVHLELCKGIFSDKVTPERPKVVFGERVSETPAQLAQTAQLLRAAEAASTETLVQLVHPDWDKTQVDEEVERIQGESAPAELTAPDPEAGMGAAGSGAPDEGGDELAAAFDELDGASQ
ncbi:phage portal protein [Actinomadura luteofluorescens]|uniref:phage portal protein n=1 Tax=Actinomadura luteofluorescens TaxID=46163 RepID=UPI003D9183B9